MINARGGLSGRVRKKSNRGFDIHRDSHIFANRATDEERFPDLKPGFNKPACCAVLIGLVIFVGGLGMTVLGYYAEQLSDLSDNDNSVKLISEKQNYQHLYNFRIVGPIIMGCGIFTILCACVVLQEAREKKKMVHLKKDTNVTQLPNYTTVTSKNTRKNSLDVVPGTSGISRLHPCNLNRSQTSMRSDSLAVPGHSVPSLLFTEDQTQVPTRASDNQNLSLSQRLAISQERFKVPNSPMIMIHRSSMSDLAMLTPVDGDKSFSYFNDAYQTTGSDSSKRATDGSPSNASIQRMSSSESGSYGSFTDSKSNSSDEGEKPERTPPGGISSEYENSKRNSKDYFEKPNLLQATLTTTRRLSITSMLSASTIDSIDEEVLLKATMMMEDVTKQTVTIPSSKDYSDTFAEKSNVKQKYVESELEDKKRASLLPLTGKDGHHNSDYPIIYVDTHDNHDNDIKTELVDAKNGTYSPVYNRGDPVIYERSRHHSIPKEQHSLHKKEQRHRSKEKRRPKSGSGRVLVRQEKHFDVHSSDSEDGNIVNKAYRTHLQEMAQNGNLPPDEVEMTTFQSKGIQVDKYDSQDTYCGVEIVREDPPLNSDIVDGITGKDLSAGQSTIRTRPSIEYNDGIREVTL
ncbi:uncharacterized protein LOC144445766 [Glandiceps talaboti]